MKTVLFVDDHEALARLSCAILRAQGYRAVSAFNAAEALEKFGREKFDILVTDWKMDGMDGLELARRVRVQQPHIPIIVVTGHGLVDGGRHVSACVDKSELFPALIEKIKLFLGQTGPTSAETEPPLEKAG